MGFTKFTKNVLNVSALPDRVQNQASSLKLVFDQAGVDIKAALNALISELEAKVAAANIGADVASVTEKNVQGILTAFENEIANRYTKAETNNAILADTNELIADVKIDLATGLLTVTKKNGTKQTFETSTEAESYAVGGTGTRPGEDTDNAKYYAQIAKQVAGGDFVTVVEMEGYAQKKGLYPNYDETELKGEVIETETTLEAESTLKLYGNSTQETRSGKNKLQDTKKVNVESNGVTFTYNADGTYTVNGTNNGNYNSALYLNTSLTLPAGTYYMIPFGVSTYSLTLYDGKNYIDLRDSKLSFTITKETTFVQIYFQIPKGTSGISNFIFYPMLATEPITKEDYEPYGAMPSPEFESPIKSVSGDVEARAEGKNLFNQGLVRTDGITEKLETGFKMTKTEASRFGLIYNTPLKAGTYKFVGNVETNIAGEGVSFQIRRIDGSSTYNKATSLFGGGVTVFGTDVVSIQPYFQETVPAGKYWQVTNFMIIEDGSPSEPYQPYNHKTISLPLGDIELRSTPDGTRDTFARVDGVWNKKENITPFTIAENMVLSVNIDRYNVPYANVPKTYIGSGVAYAKNIALLASYDEIISTAEVGHGKFATNFSAEHVAIFNSGIADLATAKTILAGETGIIKRAEPTYTPITDPALISALDELEQLVLHKGYNRITVTGVNGVKAYLELDIASTASTTNVSETETGLDMIVPVVSDTGDVLVKVPMADNQMTINPATGVVNVKGLTINGVNLDEYIRSIIGT